ncbi:hypothetical protein F4818DRAFT_241835 [Hypoxylon cercidicola]|nr:hypothetical protein F4818DRAFT_241835 [Hypoxylon cercidicola]
MFWSPGIVRIGISRDARGLKMSILIGIFSVLQPLVETPPAECGGRHVFYATSAMYASRQDGATATGVALESPLSTARGTDGHKGSGVYSVDVKGESVSRKVEELLYQDGTAEKVWNYVMEDFRRITGTKVVA